MFHFEKSVSLKHTGRAAAFMVCSLGVQDVRKAFKYGAGIVESFFALQQETQQQGGDCKVGEVALVNFGTTIHISDVSRIELVHESSVDSFGMVGFIFSELF